MARKGHGLKSFGGNCLLNFLGTGVGHHGRPVSRTAYFDYKNDFGAQ